MSPLHLKRINSSVAAASIANTEFNCRMVTLCTNFPATLKRAKTTPRDFRRFQT